MCPLAVIVSSLTCPLVSSFSDVNIKTFCKEDYDVSCVASSWSEVHYQKIKLTKNTQVGHGLAL